MRLSRETLNIVRRLNRVGQEIKQLFSRRDTAVDLMQLALLCREHALLVGPPGSGKSELVSRFAAGVQASSFQYLLTRFTEPSEIVKLDMFDKRRPSRPQPLVPGPKELPETCTPLGVRPPSPSPRSPRATA